MWTSLPRSDGYPHTPTRRPLAFDNLSTSFGEYIQILHMRLRNKPHLNSQSVDMINHFLSPPQLLLFEVGVFDGLAAQVAGNAQEAVTVVQGILTEEACLELTRRIGGPLVRQPQVAKPAEHGVLEPTNRGDNSGGLKAIRDVHKLQITRWREESRKANELLDDVSNTC